MRGVRDAAGIGALDMPPILRGFRPTQPDLHEASISMFRSRGDAAVLFWRCDAGAADECHGYLPAASRQMNRGRMQRTGQPMRILFSSRRQ